MEITITGGSGFVGSNLCDYLKSSNVIRKMSVRFIQNQEFNLKGNAIIHLAGKVHDLKKGTNSIDYYEANFELTKQLFDSFLKSDAKVFIFMSSVKAVSDDVVGSLTEDTIPNPKTHYGIAKRQAEEYIFSKKIPLGKRVYILRPCMIHGPRNKGNLNLLYELIVKGVPWPLGSFKNQRSFLSIENLCYVVKELIGNETVPSGIYNIADNDSISTNELVQLLGGSLRKNIRILRIPPSLIVKIAKVGDALNLPLNTESLRKLTESYVVSNSKISIAIQKEFPVKCKEGLLHTFESFRNIK